MEQWRFGGSTAEDSPLLSLMGASPGIGVEQVCCPLSPEAAVVLASANRGRLDTISSRLCSEAGFALALDTWTRPPAASLGINQCSPDNSFEFQVPVWKMLRSVKFTVVKCCKNVGPTVELKAQSGNVVCFTSYFNKSGCAFPPMGVDRKTTVVFSFHAGSDVNLWGQRGFYSIKLKTYLYFSAFKLWQSFAAVRYKDVLDTAQG